MNSLFTAIFLVATAVASASADVPTGAVRTTCDSFQLCPADTSLKSGSELLQCAAAVCSVEECCESTEIIWPATPTEPESTSTIVSFMGDGNTAPTGGKPDAKNKGAFVVTQDTYSAPAVHTLTDIYVVSPLPKPGNAGNLHLQLTFLGENAKGASGGVHVVDKSYTGIDYGTCTLTTKGTSADYTVECDGKMTIETTSVFDVEEHIEGYWLSVSSLPTISTITFVKKQASVDTVAALIEVFDAAQPKPTPGCDKQIKKATEKLAKQADGLANDLAKRVDMPVWAVYTLAGVTVVLVLYFLKLLLCGCSKKKQTKEQQKLEEHKQYQNLEYA